LNASAQSRTISLPACNYYMKAEPTDKHDPFKILVDFKHTGKLCEMEVVPTPLNYVVSYEGKILTKLSRRLGIGSWVQEEGTLLKAQIDQIGAAIESHFI
jgi:hypothetical protein